MLLILMQNLNLIILVFVTLIIFQAQTGILLEGNALRFLENAQSLPLAPWKTPVIALCLYFGCMALFAVYTSSRAGFWTTFFLELLSVFAISYLIDFSYSGLILLLVAESMDHIPRIKWKTSTAVLLCLLYLGFELITSFYDFGLIPFNAYLAFYTNNFRNVLLGLKSLLISLNAVLFMLFVIFVIRVQYNENEEILDLNYQLSDRNKELKAAYDQLESYSQELVSMTETKERNRLAREIHDTLGHALAGIITGLEACIALIDIAPDATKIQLKSIIEVAKQGVTDVRRSIHALRPDSLEKYSLESALITSIEEMRRATMADITYSFETDLSQFDKEEEDVIYRIVQEAVTNAIRHGKASAIQVSISQTPEYVQVLIKDNGIGCLDVKKGFGLHHMSERLQMLGGKLFYHGEIGFVICAQFPVRKPKENHHD